MQIQIKWNYQKCCSDKNQDITEMKIQEDKGLTMENIFSQEKVIVIDFGVSTTSWLQDVSENVTFTVKSIPIEQTSSRSKP